MNDLGQHLTRYSISNMRNIHEKFDSISTVKSCNFYQGGPTLKF